MISRDPQVANRVPNPSNPSFLVGAGSDSGGMGIRPYTVGGVSGGAYGLYVGDQVLDNYGNGYVVWSNGSQTYVRGNNITMYAGDDTNDSAWVQMQSNRVQIAANYNVGFDMDSSGRVKMPYQPYFNGQLSGGNASVVGVYSPGTVHINNGSRFNTSNGRFTPGVAGYVMCGFSSLINTPNTTSHAYVYFTVDGVEKTARIHTEYGTSRSYEPLTHVAVVYVPSTSSYVECQVRTMEGASLYGSPWGGGLTYALLG